MVISVLSLDGNDHDVTLSSRPSPRGECNVMVISVQGENGTVLRNSMPLLWIRTESSERVKRDCRASTVTCGCKELAAIFLALIKNLLHISTTTGKVKWLTGGSSSGEVRTLGVADGPFSPFNHRGAPCQPGAKDDQQDQIPALDLSRRDRLV